MEKQKNESRHAYMLRWRDRMIEQQRAIIAGQGEQITLLEALLQFALLETARANAGESNPESCTCRIPKAVLSASLGAWAVTVQDEQQDFTLTFTKRGTDGAEDGQACAQ